MTSLIMLFILAIFSTKVYGTKLDNTQSFLDELEKIQQIAKTSISSNEVKDGVVSISGNRAYDLTATEEITFKATTLSVLTISITKGTIRLQGPIFFYQSVIESGEVIIEVDASGKVCPFGTIGGDINIEIKKVGTSSEDFTTALGMTVNITGTRPIEPTLDEGLTLRIFEGGTDVGYLFGFSNIKYLTVLEKFGLMEQVIYVIDINGTSSESNETPSEGETPKEEEETPKEEGVSSSKKTLSIGAIAGIVIAAIVVVIIVILLVLFLLKNKKLNSSDNRSAPNNGKAIKSI